MTNVWFCNLFLVGALQDNAPTHVSEETMNWYEKNGVEVLNLPPHSPDLNVIENVWGAMAQEMAKKSITTEAELRHAVTDTWDEINYDQIRNYIDSMPARVAAVVQANGGNTRY